MSIRTLRHVPNIWRNSRKRCEISVERWVSFLLLQTANHSTSRPGPENVALLGADLQLRGHLAADARWGQEVPGLMQEKEVHGTFGLTPRALPKPVFLELFASLSPRPGCLTDPTSSWEGLFWPFRGALSFALRTSSGFGGACSHVGVGEYLLAKIGFDTAEVETSEVCQICSNLKLPFSNCNLDQLCSVWPTFANLVKFGKINLANLVALILFPFRPSIFGLFGMLLLSHAPEKKEKQEQKKKKRKQW